MDEHAKIKHSKRLQQKQNYVERQAKIAKSLGIDVKEKHRLHKHSLANCGNSDCVMCGNPRKFFKEPTIQEKRFDQEKAWE